MGRILNSSEDELSGIFTFDPQSSAHNSPAASNAMKMPTTSPQTPSSAGQAANGEPASNCKSPYENVCALPPPVPPHSPRTRIRTTLASKTNGGLRPEESDGPPPPPAPSNGHHHTYQLITSGVAAEVMMTILLYGARSTG